MRLVSSVVVLALVLAAVGCGSSQVGAPSSQVATSSTISVTLQAVHPSASTQVTASARSTYPISQWQIYVDSALVFTQASSAPRITQSVSLDPGKHQIAVRATNSTGASGSASAAVTVQPQSTSATTPPGVLSVSMQPIGSKSPATVTASAHASNSITGWVIYVDSQVAFRKDTSSSKISEGIAMAEGKHQVIARVWDNTGAYASATAHVDIQSASSSSSSGSGGSTNSMIPTPPSSAKTWKGVEDMGGWVDCGACAGNPSGTGPVGDFWFKQGVTSPSLDGNSMQTFIGGYVPWADNLFVHKFGPQTWANHIIYTVHFLWNAPTEKTSSGNYVVQAMEFDSYFSGAGFKYMFGSQCDYAGGYWDIWNNPQEKWQHTYLKCNKFAPNQWHTMTWYVERDQSKKQLHFVVLKVDGTEYKIDTWIPAVGSSWGDDFGVQFQQDTNGAGDPWYEYVDEISATIW